MRIAQHSTAISCYHEKIAGSQQSAQCGRILEFIETRGGDWSIGEIAAAMKMEKSTVSARINHMLNETHELVEKPKRKDRISKIRIRPVGLPATQAELFQ